MLDLSRIISDGKKRILNDPFGSCKKIKDKIDLSLKESNKNLGAILSLQGQRLEKEGVIKCLVTYLSFKEDRELKFFV